MAETETKDKGGKLERIRAAMERLRGELEEKGKALDTAEPEQVATVAAELPGLELAAEALQEQYAAEQVAVQEAHSAKELDAARAQFAELRKQARKLASTNVKALEALLDLAGQARALQAEQHALARRYPEAGLVDHFAAMLPLSAPLDPELWRKWRARVDVILARYGEKPL